MVLETPPSLQVCFWYLPKGIEFLDQEVKDSKKNQMWEENITLVTKEIHKRIRDHGKFLFDYAPIELNGKRLPPFFRIVINTPSINEHYLDELVKEIEETGEGLLEFLDD